jgi:glucokinase
MTAPAFNDTRLLADIGGTNARFAWQSGPGAPLEDVLTLPCADFDTIEAAMRSYLERIGRGQPARCAMGIANPITGDRVQMTNHHWSFSIEALRQAIGLNELVVINDFTALALAIPLLEPHERRLMRVGPQQAVAGKAIGVLGAGTGLGVGGLLPFQLPGGPLQWAPIEGEGVLRAGVVGPWPGQPAGCHRRGAGAHGQLERAQRRRHRSSRLGRLMPGVRASVVHLLRAAGQRGR